jgi:hypothetical protein
MKFLLLTLAVFSLAIGGLHAQVSPGDASILVDPVVKAAVEAALPAKYAGYTGLALIAIMWLGRAVPVLQAGSGLVGWFKAILFGTNTPHILLACLCLLTLPSCATDATTGKKSFLGRTGDQWLGIGEDAAMAAVRGGIIGYGQREAVELTSGK